MSNRASSGPGTSTSSATGGERLSGLGRILITVYLVLALAATFRSVYQIISKFDEAPVAYTLSAVSGVVYIVATVALIMGVRAGARANGRIWRGIAWVALVFELCGVLIVGTLSLTTPEFFAHPSVWSFYGSGYLFIPLVLPVLGLIWLRRTGRSSDISRAAAPATAKDHV
ncbi:hypothetical protein EDF62_3150 [Leucobacter luti]|uniref:Integral membrane protein n=1 Tax=Leucobacter luti TaxID=340320 RepID=A0A4R6RSR4_9MICO|nr:hypothetical protein [Leucobacter luti]TDP89852.1 hypothetical protein EDF62_3150 [Leucobacter luti]